MTNLKPNMEDFQAPLSSGPAAFISCFRRPYFKTAASGHLRPFHCSVNIAALAANWIVLSIVLSFSENPAVLQISITDCWEVNLALHVCIW